MALLLAAPACVAGDASETLTVPEQRAIVAADSAAGDSAALATLPPALQGVLRLEPYLTAGYLQAADSAACVSIEPPGAGGGLGLPAGGERRRVRMLLPDSSELAMLVRADAGNVGLEHVELVRTPLYGRGERLGYIWDDEQDLTVEVRWPADRPGRTERAPQPRGGPVPRAVRALGRLVLALPCVPESLLPPPPDTVDTVGTGPAPEVPSLMDVLTGPPPS